MDLRRERVALADVVASAVEAAQPALDAAGHELIVTLPRAAVHLDADKTRIPQVFANLLTNSTKYTPKGGKVVLAMRAVGLARPRRHRQHPRRPVLFDHDHGLGQLEKEVGESPS